MRRSISILLTTLLLSAAILPAAVYAQGSKTRQTSLNLSYVANQPSPFNLAYLAYQSYLKNQGIPRSGALSNEIRSRTIMAQDVMQAAVKANRLSEQTLNDQGYRSALEDQLQKFKR